MADSNSGDTEAHRSSDPNGKRGGWITLPFILVTLLGMSITSFGWIMNLIVFLIEEFNIKNIAAAQISNVVSGVVNMLPVVAAILADSFFGNVPIIAASTFMSLIGTSLLTLISSLDYLRPRPCETDSILCQSPSKPQLGVLYLALALVIIGSAGTRFTLASAGANQYTKPKEQASFFNWFFVALYTGAITGTAAIVYTQDNVSWKLGFGLCAVANLISFIVFIAGKRFYKSDKPLGSPYTSLIRVLVAATLKRKAVITSKEEDYHHSDLEKESKTSASIPSDSFRFLNRGALKNDEASVSNKWRLCSVQEVEDFKIVLRLLPLWAAEMFLATPVGVQMSMTVLQALVMDRELSPHFKVSAGSLQVIVFLSGCVFIMLNNWTIYPLYKKLIRKRLTPLQQVGIGHVFTILSMAVSALVEAKRLKTVDDNGHPMSVLWLVPALVLVGIGEAFHFPANVAVFYGEFPESLKNTATSLTSVVIGISFYLSTALIDVIQRTTPWLPDDINHGRVDNVYWVLVIGGVLNFGYFLVCSWVYKYRNLKNDDQKRDLKDVTT
ncbi:PREDICTED: protein NRT1/ PTR FAMILY 2.5-like [Camelina sativa]|uniref:Protein NRT1/ PTR FAMILY 2.5-like n=1 Tax=Camelina sativa TaxID=90675 RepID=A0ABM0ZF61_CAMSA|nr:PREDICTED: protein NRT1/ PTR FAMILY 2.5-like [Camelina sativa]